MCRRELLTVIRLPLEGYRGDGHQLHPAAHSEVHPATFCTSQLQQADVVWTCVRWKIECPLGCLLICVTYEFTVSETDYWKNLWISYDSVYGSAVCCMLPTWLPVEWLGVEWLGPWSWWDRVWNNLIVLSCITAVTYKWRFQTKSAIHAKYCSRNWPRALRCSATGWKLNLGWNVTLNFNLLVLVKRRF